MPIYQDDTQIDIIDTALADPNEAFQGQKVLDSEYSESHAF